jgi:hypothetical protein
MTMTGETEGLGGKLVTVPQPDLYTFSPYRAVNILRLGYKNQSVNAV